MSKKGIIIDVGFTSDTRELIDKIESSLSSIDFSDVLKLDDAFDKQLKKVREKLSVLKTELDNILSGADAGNIQNQIRNLENSVNTLKNNLRDLSKLVPSATGNAAAQSVAELSGEVDELATSASNATKFLKDLGDVNTQGLKNESNEIEKLLKQIETLLDADYDEPKTRKGIESIKKELSSLAIQYSELVPKLQQIGPEDAQYASIVHQILSIVDAYQKLYQAATINSKVDLNALNSHVVDGVSIEEYFDMMTGSLEEYKEELEKRRSEIRSILEDITNPNNIIAETKKQVSEKTDGIIIPINIKGTSTELTKTALRIINSVQKNISKNPLEVRMVLVSDFKSKRNQKLLSEIQEQMLKLDDGEVKNQLSTLIADMQSKFAKDVGMEVSIETEKAEVALREFIKLAREELKTISDEVPPITPDFYVTDEAKADLYAQIQQMFLGFSFDLGEIKIPDQMAELKESVLEMQRLLTLISGINNTRNMNAIILNFTRSLTALDRIITNNNKDFTEIKELLREMTSLLTNSGLSEESAKLGSDVIKSYVESIKDGSPLLQEQLAILLAAGESVLNDYLTSNDGIGKYKDFGKRLAESIADGISGGESDIINAIQALINSAGTPVGSGLVKGYRAQQEGDAYAAMSNHKNKQTFWDINLENAKTYGGGRKPQDIFAAYILNSQLFQYNGYGQKWDKLTYLGDGSTKNSDALLKSFDAIIDVLKKFEEISSATLKTTKRNGYITEFINNLTGDHSRDLSTDFSKFISSESSIGFFESLVNSVEDEYKEIIQQMINALKNYQDVLREAKNENQQYGNNVKTDTYGKRLQKLGNYKGIQFNNIYDGGTGHDFETITTDFLIFNKNYDDVVKLAYIIKGGQNALDAYIEYFETFAKSVQELTELDKKICDAVVNLVKAIKKVNTSNSLDDSVVSDLENQIKQISADIDFLIRLKHALNNGVKNFGNVEKGLDKQNRFFALADRVKAHGSFDLRKSADKQELQDIIREFISYKNDGGVYDLSDMKVDSKVLAQLTKEYERQNAVIAKNTKLKEENTHSDSGLNTETSSSGISTESGEMKNLADNAADAAAKKKEFAEANKEVLASIIESLKGLDSEGQLFANLTKLISLLSGKTGNERLEQVVSGLNEIRTVLSKQVNKNSLVMALQELSKQGDNLKNLATILKASKKEIESVKTAVINDGKEKQSTSNINVDNSIIARIKALKKEYKEYWQLKQKSYDGTITALEIQRLNKIEQEYQNIENEINDNVISLKDYNTVMSEFRELATSASSSFGKSIQSEINSAAKQLKVAVQNKEFMPDFEGQLLEAQKAIEHINDLFKSNSEITEDNITQLSVWLKQIRSVRDGLTIQRNLATANSTVDKYLQKINKDLNDNTNMARDLREEYERLKSKLEYVRNNSERINKLDMRSVVNEFQKLHAALEASDKRGKSFIHTMSDFIKSKNAQFFAQFFSFYDIIRYARQAVDSVRALDTALVDLRKTTTMSASELEKFYYDSNDVAKSLGVTTEEVINQASSWSRLGYSSAEAATEMAKLSSQFAAISPGMSTEEAQTGLVSLMKAWKVDVVDVERELLDNINTLGNKFALTNLDIIEGMERAGATLSAVGMDIQDSFALFTGAQEVIQNAETVGTALKTLSLRIRGESLPPYAVTYMMCA